MSLRIRPATPADAELVHRLICDLAAYERDRDFDRGAPMTVLGRYYYSLPWPKRDLERSRQYLEEVRARHPKVRIARWYLAETYHALADHEKARSEIDFLLTARGSGDHEPDDPTPLVRLACQAQCGGDVTLAIAPWNGELSRRHDETRAKLGTA